MQSDSPRRLLHTRQVVCRAYQRDDGLIDIEGFLLDSKPEEVDTDYRRVAADTPFHQMRLLLSVDADFVIQAARASTEAAPTPICGNIAGAYSALVGLHIGPGFKRQVAKRLGGVQGCTHLTDLLGPMATTLIQSTFVARREAVRQRLAADPTYVQPKPWVIGSCHTYHPEGEAARRIWPQGQAQPATIATDGD
jgi:hypothetical protein